MQAKPSKRLGVSNQKKPKPADDCKIEYRFDISDKLRSEFVTPNTYRKNCTDIYDQSDRVMNLSRSSTPSDVLDWDDFDSSRSETPSNIDCSDSFPLWGVKPTRLEDSIAETSRSVTPSDLECDDINSFLCALHSGPCPMFNFGISCTKAIPDHRNLLQDDERLNRTHTKHTKPLRAGNTIRISSQEPSCGDNEFNYNPSLFQINLSGKADVVVFSFVKTEELLIENSDYKFSNNSSRRTIQLSKRIGTIVESCGGLILLDEIKNYEYDVPIVIPIGDLSGDKHALSLYVESRRRSGDMKDLFRLEYVEDCARAGKRLDLNLYRFAETNFETYDANDVMNMKIKWSNLAEKRLDVLHDESFMDSSIAISGRSTPTDVAEWNCPLIAEADNGEVESEISSLGKNPHKMVTTLSLERLTRVTQHEKQTLLDYICKKKLFKNTGGNSMWKQIELDNIIKYRTWGTLRNTFRRCILPRGKLENFRVRHSDYKRLCKLRSASMH